MRSLYLVLGAFLIASMSATALASHHVCTEFSVPGGNTVYYSIMASASQTKLERYDLSTNPPTLLDVNLYGALAKPNPPGSNFDVGVAFAAEMQNRNAWPLTAQTSGANWDVLSATSDRWRFHTTMNGAPFVLTFATENCHAATPSQPPQTAQPTPAQVTTVAPPPAPTAAPTPGAHHVCLSFSVAGGPTVYYSIMASASLTQMKRYDMSTSPATLIDVNDFAALAKPNPAGSHWGDGVAFAATMQTRNAWPTTAATTAGYWDVLSATQDRWRFQTSLNGAPFELTFATENCHAV